MHNSTLQGFIIFMSIASLLIVSMTIFVSVIVHKYQQKQTSHIINLEKIKATHERNLLQSQIELQEQTFQNISREIHDSIGQKLTLAKLMLNTINLETKDTSLSKITETASILGEAIEQLSDISRSLSTDLILNNGLIKAVEFEVAHILKLGIFQVNLEISGDPVFLHASKELIAFRIIQEALNNIIKHSEAKKIRIAMNFSPSNLDLEIVDDGKGFSTENRFNYGTGIVNMQKRASILNGSFEINSVPKNGSIIKITIPIHERTNAS